MFRHVISRFANTSRRVDLWRHQTEVFKFSFFVWFLSDINLDCQKALFFLLNVQPLLNAFYCFLIYFKVYLDFPCKTFYLLFLLMTMCPCRVTGMAFLKSRLQVCLVERSPLHFSNTCEFYNSFKKTKIPSDAFLPSILLSSLFL